MINSFFVYRLASWDPALTYSTSRSEFLCGVLVPGAGGIPFGVPQRLWLQVGLYLRAHANAPLKASDACGPPTSNEAPEQAPRLASEPNRTKR
jgi:hypothetical protein